MRNLRNAEHVLYVIGSLGLGGSESQLLLLMKEVKKYKINCTLFVLEANGPLFDKFSSLGIPIVDGGYSSHGFRVARLLRLARSIFKLWLTAKRNRPDVLHAFLPLTNFLGAICGRAAGVPCVVTSRRGLGSHQDRYPLWRTFDRISNMLSNYVTVNSKAVLEDTVSRDGIKLDKLCLIRNGLDVSSCLFYSKSDDKDREKFDINESTILIIKVANLIPYKGHKDIISALVEVIKIVPDVKLFFAGDDRGIQVELMKYAKKIGVDQNIEFLGLRDDVPKLLSVMDIAVVASHEEGLSNALIEEMASGLPIVATAVGGNCELIEESGGGFLVEPGSVAELASAIIKLAKDSDLRTKLGALGASYAREKFSIDAMAKANLDLYNKGLNLN